MAYRSGSTTTDGNGTSSVITVPTGAASGDIAVVTIYLESNAAITPPAGFTQKADIDSANAATHGRIIIFWKRLSAADTGSYTFSWTGSTWAQGACVLFSGRSTTGDPFEATNTLTAATDTTPDVPGVTATASADLFCAISQFATASTWTAPTGMTTRTSTAGQGVIATATQDAVSAGATGTETWTLNASGFAHGFLGSLNVPGGSNLTDTPTDAEGITDSAADVQDYVRSQGDAQGVTDAATGAADRPRPQADPVGLTDSLAALLSRDYTVNDAEGVTDSAGAIRAFDRSQPETVGLTDSLGVSWDRAATISDNLGVSDPGSSQDRDDAVTDALGITDSATASQSGNGAASVNDAAGITDAVTAVFDRISTVADFLGLTDSAGSSQSSSGSATVNDGEGVTDSAAWTTDRSRAPADPVGLSDSALAVLDRVTTTADALGITDTVTVVRAGANDGTPVRQPGLTLTSASSRLALTSPTSTLELDA